MNRPTTHSVLLRASLLGAPFAALVVSLAPTAAAQEIQPRVGDPVAGLSAAQAQRFRIGSQVFSHILTIGEGLGPAFNDTSCGHCHLSPTPGGSSGKFVTRFGKAASGGNPFDPLTALGGTLLQAQSINSPSCDEVIPPQANVTTHRVTPPTFGYGLVEAIADADILVNETNPPPGVSGHTQHVQPAEDPTGPLRIGRFGWKAQVATLLTFSGDASVNEMGLTNRLFSTEQAPNGNLATLALCDTVPDPEDFPDAQGYDKIDRMTDFQKFLAPPPQTPRNGMSGEALFNAVGCSACHLSTHFQSGSTAEAPLNNKFFTPYSDFLVHDMGSLGDGIPQGSATEVEFRTPPLWGVRQRAKTGLLHDHRVNSGSPAQMLDQAIGLHDGEALASRNAYVLGLTPAQQNKLLAFLDSLGRLEFDYEGNNNVDEFDWFFLQPLVTGPAPVTPISPDDAAAVADFDQDGDFDLEDFGVMQRAFTGT